MLSETSIPVSAITKGVNDAIVAFRASLPPEVTIKKEEEYTNIYAKDYLRFTSRMRSFYYFLKDDALSAANLQNKILEEIQYRIKASKTKFDELDKVYKNLIPPLSENVKAAQELNKKSGLIQTLSRDLAKDIHQKDSLVEELIKKSVTATPTETDDELKPKIDALDKELANSIPSTDDPFNIKSQTESINKIQEELKNLFLNDLAKINLPALLPNLNAFSAAVDALIKDLDLNIKNLDKAKEDASKAIKSSSPSVNGKEILKKLIGETKLEGTAANNKTPKPTKFELELEKKNETLAKAQADLDQATALLTLKTSEETSVKNYTQALELTNTLIVSLNASFDNLIASFNTALVKNSFEKVSNTLLEKGKVLYDNIESLSKIDQTILELNNKLSGKDAPGDVKEYLTRLGNAMKELVGPAKNFTGKLLENGKALSKLHLDLEALHSDYFEELEKLLANSSLAKAKVGEKMEIVKKELTEKKEKDELNKEILLLKKEIEGFTSALNQATTASLEAKNKVELDQLLK